MSLHRRPSHTSPMRDFCELRQGFQRLFFFPCRGDAHLIVSTCFVNATFHASAREPCRTRRNKRCHPVQQEKQAKVTLEPEESLGGARKERNALSVQCGLRFDPAPVWL